MNITKDHSVVVDTYPVRIIKNRTITQRVSMRLVLIFTLLINFYYLVKKWEQVRTFYSLNKDFFEIYDNLVKKDISVFLTPHWEKLNSKFENYLRAGGGVPLGFLRDRMIGYAMFVSGGSAAMKTELDKLKEVYSDKELDELLEEEAVGMPIITDIKHKSSHNSVRHLHHILRFIERTKVDVNSINSVLEWGGGYGNFAKIFKRTRNSKENLTYNIVDTPLFSCIQWLYLSSVLGKDKVNIIKTEEDSVVEGKINIIPIGFVDKIKNSPDLFVSTWALSESSIYSQDYVLSKNFWSAKHLLVVYQESNKDLPDAGRLGMLIENVKKDIIKEKVAYMSYPSYYLLS